MAPVTKRSASVAPQGPTAKRRKAVKADPPLPTFIREDSPSKNVHFKRNLIQGRSVSNPARRSESPTRSALRKPEIDRSREYELKAQNEQKQAQNDQKKAEIEALREKKKELAAKVAELKARQSEERNTALQADVEGSKRGLLQPSENVHSQVCDQLNDLKLLVKEFYDGFQAPPKFRKEDVVRTLLKPDNEQLVRYIGCLAMGGKTGEDGWRELLHDKVCIQALVFGIVGRALKEHVFGSLYFGGDQELLMALSKQEKELAHLDGFFRTKRRANTIRQHQAKRNAPPTGVEAAARLTIQLERLLFPLWKLSGNAATWKSSNKRDTVAEIVVLAANLSHTIRQDADTVYYWPPTFKDEEFEPSRMECFNLREMIEASPYDKKTINGIDRAILKEGFEAQSEAIVQVVAFPGLVAYQQGGGELAQEELAKENQREGSVPKDVQAQRRIAMQSGKGELTGEEGFRTTVLGKSVVVLQWGNQRLLTKEAGTSAHIDAMRAGNQKKYDVDYVGFVELYDLFLDWNEKALEEAQASERPSTQQRSSSWFGKFNLFQRETSPSGATELEDLSFQSRKGSKSSRSGGKASR